MNRDKLEYRAKVIGPDVEISKHGWHGTKVGIFEGENQIGEYIRNYGSFGEATFFAFQQGEQWYALYSKDYTCTRLMKLPECIDIGGEDCNGNGFCPTAYYVPRLCGQILKPEDPRPGPPPNHLPDVWAEKKEIVTEKGQQYTRYVWPDDPESTCTPERKEEFKTQKEKRHKEFCDWLDRNLHITRYATWGFISGCHWGDDSSWKVQFLDLSRASEGILVRDQRFGYIELPSGVDLVDAVRVEDPEELTCPLSEISVQIALPVRFKMTGERVKED